MCDYFRVVTIYTVPKTLCIASFRTSTLVGAHRMRITGPQRYKLTFDATAFVVECEKGTPKFSGIVTSKKPKLYIASVDEAPIYVGVTKQSIRNRLRFGWNAAGEGGYYGYAWRHGSSVTVGATVIPA